MKDIWLRRLLRGFSLTSAMFIFQACYGVPQDFGYDLFITGNVKAKSTGLPIKGIKVSNPLNYQYYLTDDQGHFSFYTETSPKIKIMFEDIDSLENGLYNNKDTILTNPTDHVSLEIIMEEK